MVEQGAGRFEGEFFLYRLRDKKDFGSAFITTSSTVRALRYASGPKAGQSAGATSTLEDDSRAPPRYDIFVVRKPMLVASR